MKRTAFSFSGIAALAGGILALFIVAIPRPLSAQDAPPGDPNAQSNVEVLTRGPVHEAFAEPVVYQSQSVTPLVVPTAPPQPLDEQVPDSAPAAEGAIWIPGYWGWDDDRKGYIWVSGIWRVPPPGYTWVAGYWVQAQGGWQWVPGFWEQAQSSDVEYLPEPPAITQDMDPVGFPPNADSVWVPGVWVWSDARYAWRRGYWMDGRPDWIWTPAHYVGTPAGFVFLDGFWDYGLDRRGVLFAPVAFRAGITAGFRFSPGFVIDVGIFNDGLFCRPGFNHYYFGDYYADSYWRAGIFPAFSFQGSRLGYDPLYAWARADFRRRGVDYDDYVRDSFRFRRDHPEARPPRTWSEQTARLSATQAGGRAVASSRVAVPLRDPSAATVTKLRLEPTKPELRQKFTNEARSFRDSGVERAKAENRAAAAPRTQQPTRIPFKPAAQPTRNAAAAPARPIPPAPARNAEPRREATPAERRAEPVKPREAQPQPERRPEQKPVEPRPEPPKRPEQVQPARPVQPVQPRPAQPERQVEPRPAPVQPKPVEPERRVEPRPAPRPEPVQQPRPVPEQRPVVAPRPDGDGSYRRAFPQIRPAPPRQNPQPVQPPQQKPEQRPAPRGGDGQRGRQDGEEKKKGGIIV